MAREKGSDEDGISFGHHPGHTSTDDADAGGAEEKKKKKKQKTKLPQSRQKQLTEETKLKRLD